MNAFPTYISELDCQILFKLDYASTLNACASNVYLWQYCQDVHFWQQKVKYLYREKPTAKALMKAAQHKQKDLILMLLEAGVSPFVKVDSYSLRTTPLEALFDYSGFADLHILQRIVELIQQNRLSSANNIVFDANEFIASKAEYFEHTSPEYKAKLINLISQMQVNWPWAKEEKDILQAQIEEAQADIAEAWSSIQEQAIPSNYEDLEHYASLLTNVATQLSWLK